MPRRKSTPKRDENALLRKRRRNEVNLNREIAALQSVDIPLIPKLPFSRLVRETMQAYKNDYRITATALAALQEACEYYLTFLFSDAYLLTYHRKRMTLDRSDIRMVLYIREKSNR